MKSNPVVTEKTQRSEEQKSEKKKKKETDDFPQMFQMRVVINRYDNLMRGKPRKCNVF